MRHVNKHHKKTEKSKKEPEKSILRNKETFTRKLDNLKEKSDKKNCKNKDKKQKEKCGRMTKDEKMNEEKISEEKIKEKIEKPDEEKGWTTYHEQKIHYERIGGELYVFGECAAHMTGRCDKEDVLLHKGKHWYYCKEYYEEAMDCPKYNRAGEDTFKNAF